MEADEAREAYYRAVSNGDIEKVKEILLKQKVVVNSKDASGLSPLHRAIVSPRSGIEVPKILIENGADVNQERGGLKCAPLFLASIYGRKRIVDLLLENGADVNAKDEDERTSLHWALRSMQTSDHFEIVKILLKNGAYINAPDSSGKTPLHTAVSERLTSATKILLQSGRYINAPYSSGQTPLHTAVSERFTSAIKILLEHKADVNAVDKYGKTPLHYACYDSTSILDTIVILRLLLQYGADVNAKDNAGHTSLHWALRSKQTSDHFKIVKILLENGAYINAPDSYGQTPLHTAISGRFTSAIKILLEQKADVKAVDEYGRTPLHCASCYSAVIQRLLLQYGADVKAVDKRGGTPLHTAINPLAVYKGNSQLRVEILIRHGADVNTHDINGLTPLHNAVKWGTSRIVMALLDAGADVKNEEGKKALIRRLIGHTSWESQPVREHVISLKVAGLYVNELYIQALTTVSDQSVHSIRCERFEKMCGQELERMKDIKLKSNFLLMYILTTNNPRYVRNQALMQQLESIESGDFPIYGKLLKRKLETDKVKSLLLEESKVSLEKLIKKDERTRHLFIPSELLEKIVCHLSCSDLRNLVSCAQVRSRLEELAEM